MILPFHLNPAAAGAGLLILLIIVVVLVVLIRSASARRRSRSAPLAFGPAQSAIAHPVTSLPETAHADLPQPAPEQPDAEQPDPEQPENAVPDSVSGPDATDPDQVVEDTDPPATDAVTEPLSLGHASITPLIGQQDLNGHLAPLNSASPTELSSHVDALSDPPADADPPAEPDLPAEPSAANPPAEADSPGEPDPPAETDPPAAANPPSRIEPPLEYEAAKDRLLRVLLTDPDRAVSAVGDLEECRGQLDRLNESVEFQRRQLAHVARRLRGAGLTAAQVAQLAGFGEGELVTLLSENSPSPGPLGGPQGHHRSDRV
jgi:chemotaxis protein histidine kinase CheA